MEGLLQSNLRFASSLYREPFDKNSEFNLTKSCPRLRGKWLRMK